MTTSLLALKASGDSIELEQKKLLERKRNILVLIYQFLVENGYLDSATSLNTVAGSTLSKYILADNIDIATVLSEYEIYYELKYGKKPKITKKLSDDVENSPRKVLKSKENKNQTNRCSPKLPQISPSIESSDIECLEVQGTNFQISDIKQKLNKMDEDPITERYLKPPPQYGNDTEMRQLSGIISREIYQDSPNIRFHDIVDLEQAKRLLVEAVQLPLRYPTIFTGILRPWRGILLHGPPGTGKTLLAKALATECQTTFFNISASTLISKWRGESEKLVRVLFDLARHYSPSTIFLDEIDSILSSRSGSGEGSEHEASRRMKTELLIQMDGIKGLENSQVFVLAASNLPWDLDIAVLRRLEKRVFVCLPGEKARETMLQKLLSGRISDDIDFSMIASQTEGYSGADIELVCREAAMIPVRRLMQKLDNLPKTVSLDAKHKLNRKTNILNQNANDVVSLLDGDKVNQTDLLTALSTTRPSSDGKSKRYEEWQLHYGSV